MLENTCDCGDSPRTMRRKHIHETTTIEDITYEETVSNPAEISFHHGGQLGGNTSQGPWTYEEEVEQLYTAINAELGTSVRFPPFIPYRNSAYAYVDRLNAPYDVDEKIENAVANSIRGEFSQYGGVEIDGVNPHASLKVHGIGQHIAAARWILDRWGEDDSGDPPTPVQSLAKKARGLSRDSTVNDWDYYRVEAEIIAFDEDGRLL